MDCLSHQRAHEDASRNTRSLIPKAPGSSETGETARESVAAQYLEKAGNLVTPKRHIRGDSYGQSCMSQLAYHRIDLGTFSYSLVRRRVHHRPEVGIKRYPLAMVRPFVLRPGIPMTMQNPSCVNACLTVPVSFYGVVEKGYVSE